MARCTQCRLTLRECFLIGHKGEHSHSLLTCACTFSPRVNQLLLWRRVVSQPWSNQDALRDAAALSAAVAKVALPPMLLHRQGKISLDGPVVHSSQIRHSLCFVSLRCLAWATSEARLRGRLWTDIGCRDERVGSCCAHLTKLVSLNWSQSPADLTPWEELDGSGPRFFTGYCCCCSLASDCYLSPWGRSPRCCPPGSRHSSVTPSEDPRLGGDHGWKGARCFGTRIVAVLKSKSARHCYLKSASFPSSASSTSVVSYFLLRLEAGLPCPLL